MQKPTSEEDKFPHLPINLEACKLFDFSTKRISPKSSLFFEEFREIRTAAYHINIKRSFDKANKEDVHYAKPSELNAASLLNSIYNKIFESFETSLEPEFRKKLTNNIEKKLSKNRLKELTNSIEKIFPYKLKISQESKLADIMIRAIIIRLNNENPALKEYQDLFSDLTLISNPMYNQIFKQVELLFSSLAKPGNEKLNLLEFLREPFKKYPNSLYDQLAFISKNWKIMIGEFLDTLLLALDFIKEENKPVFEGFGPPQTPDLGLLNDEYEAFTDDSSWMPNVIMLAKSTLVWLDQLSKKYDQSITRLNDIPNEELDIISSHGFTSLWLIGIWERSIASKRIKHIYGNYEAEASAYSLHDYEIATALGGWDSLQKLRARCNKRGIRLASDMVPNHTAIDSRWVINHPDWFLQLPNNPMPNYNFTGEDLSSKEDVGLYLEDQYYSQTDCAVVFQRTDHNSGENRYIYHGNDGTGLPWNDTAQIDFLNPEAREAVIQTILHVARNFSVIRFDAAMTLAKKHIQRLWFPAPGQGGDIPTRVEHTLSTEDFNKAIPKEFWREVVDRIAIEAPDTLLLAEAFWMLEGYFVRTLGMHRVYNSAFMHMLRDEHNKKYRNLIKETLEFDPQILKRYVNFMNNPDEETSAEQYGKGDKYFGVCMLLSTLPGLPMFGHGQVEGFYEKYGMEFKKSQWNEQPDEWLIKRHKKEIFPILKKRYLFSEVHNFRFYNFNDSQGSCNENVFAYSNNYKEENVLVIYNNSFNTVSGTVFSGVPFKDKTTGLTTIPNLDNFISTSTNKKQNNDEKMQVIFTEMKSGLDFIRTYNQLTKFGLNCLLNGYEYQIFENFRIVEDKDGSLEKISEILNGIGINDILFEAKMLKFKEAHTPLLELLNCDTVEQLKAIYTDDCQSTFEGWTTIGIEEFHKEIEKSTKFPSLNKNRKIISQQVHFNFEKLAKLVFNACNIKSKISSGVTAFVSREFFISKETPYILLAWSFLKACEQVSKNWITDFDLINFVRVSFSKSDNDKDWKKTVKAISILTDCGSSKRDLKKILMKDSIQEFLNINVWEDTMWFDIEPFEDLLTWLFFEELLDAIFLDRNEGELEKIGENYIIRHNALLDSNYKLSEFIANIE